MGHYYSEMYSQEELDKKEKEKKRQLEKRTKIIQKQIDEKGIARFLAEMSVSTYDGKITGIW